MKILHLSDIHARDKDIEEVEKCLNFIVEQAEKEIPDLIVFTGDAFDSQNVKLDSLSAKLIICTFSRLGDIAPVVGVLGTPSHDGRAPEILSYVKARYPVFIASHPCQMYLSGGGELFTAETLAKYQPSLYAVISLIPQPTKQYFTGVGGIASTDEQISSAMTAIFAGFGATAEAFQCPHILVGHFTVRGCTVSSGQQMIGRDIEISKEQIAFAKADLVCLGHIHKEQVIPPNIFYSGSIFRVDWSELEDKGFYVYTLGDNLAKDGMVYKFIPTPSKKYVRAEIDTTGGGSFDDIDMGYLNLQVKDSYARIDITVFQDEADKIDKHLIEEDIMSRGALDVDVRITRIPRENVRSEKILKLSTLRDKLVEQARLRAEEVPETILEKADLLETTNHDDLINALCRA